MADVIFIGMNEDCSLIQVKRTEPDECFKPGGSLYGYRQTYGINHYTFTMSKEQVMEWYEITEEEYNEWDAKFKRRYNPVTEEWSK